VITALPPGTPESTARAYGLLGPLTRGDPDSAWPLLALVAGLVAGERPLREFAEAPGAEVLLRPETAPADWLPLLAAVSGAVLPAGAAINAQRLEVRNPSGRRRGGPDAVEENVRRQLRPGAGITFRARTHPTLDGDHRWHALLEVRRTDLLPELTTGTAAASNLVPNPALLVDTGEWIAQNAVIARSTGGPSTGSHSLRVQAGAQPDPQAWTPVGARPPGTPLQAAATVQLPDTAPGPSVVRCALELGGLYPAPISSVDVELRPGETQTVLVSGVVPSSPAWDELGSDYPTWADIVDDYPTWAALIAGHPSWADANAVGTRLVVGGPRDPGTGASQAGRAVYWADPHVNVGDELDPYGHGGLAGWLWTGDANASTSVRPDTRDSPALRRAYLLALPAGVKGHLRWVTANNTWEALTRRYPTWAAVMSAFPTWQQMLDATPED
jgi:hypothetical protein